MGLYSSQLIEELAAKVDPILRDFFKKSSIVYTYPANTLTDYIDMMIDEYFDPVDTTDIKIKYQSELTNRRSKKKNWLDKTKKNRATYSLDDQKSFFSGIPMDTLNKSDYYMSMYGTTNPDDIVDLLISKIETWRKSSEYLIECPYLTYLGNISIQASFKSDLFVNLYQIIRDDYHGNLNNWLIREPTPESMNVFASSKGSEMIVQDKDSNKFIVELFSSDSVSITFADISEELAKEYDQSMPILDVLDREIVTFLINNTVLDVKNPSIMITQQTTTIGEIAKVVFQAKNPSAQQREKIRVRLKRYTTPIRFENKISGEYVSWTILSSCNISDEDDKGVRTVRYTLGSDLQNSMLKQRIAYLPSSQYKSLESGATKNLYVFLQYERFKVALNPGSLTQKYTFGRLFQALLLRDRSTKKKKDTVTAALNELLEKKVIIEDMTIGATEISISFIPLSPQEHSDLISQTQNLIE